MQFVVIVLFERSRKNASGKLFLKQLLYTRRHGEFITGAKTIDLTQTHRHWIDSTAHYVDVSSVLVLWIASQIIAPCPTHPDVNGIPLWTIQSVFIILITMTYKQLNILLSSFRSEASLNWEKTDHFWSGRGCISKVRFLHSMPMVLHRNLYFNSR